MTDNRKSAIAAAIILIGFGIVAYLMPRIVLAVGDYSTVAAAAVAVVFVLGFFMIFWLRARVQKRRD
ncbi:hypothetical protein NA8A_09923 [Nitratireductor indicus C115]|uniref:Uncharacterized protein n=1 Tax=Nitratireductor indicus C115 TaxID=1231190 RepID=K2NSP7_9HYPH|nr:hypothetical protein [Nitratireductor indicus]EKF42370.1 hypothetical protein NA8A_09923 [Nitratireductor indicus C115]SFQ55381.1 hypothetical protein SAMN05216176_10617 [Nitratireductor indicus]